MEKSILKVEGHTVEFHDKITWGMQEKIRAAMYGGLNVKTDRGDNQGAPSVEFNAGAITNSKYKTIEVLIKKITKDDGTEVTYSKDWLDNLSVEDGDAVYNKANAISNPEKK